MKLNRKKTELAMARTCLDVRSLADRADMRPQTINRALYGRNVLPATLGRIARALGVDPAELMETEEVNA